MRCEVDSCNNEAMPGVHHKKLRKRGGTDSPENTMKVCFDCHRAIHDHMGEWTKRYRTFSWQIEGQSEEDV